jgi:photosystem II stability/assembly factor-like uncharacterized protein
MNTLTTLAVLAMSWLPQASNSTAGLRGLSVVSSKIAWASGAKGTVLRTLNGGKEWQTLKVAGAEALDFRDVQGFDAKTALLLASGSGQASRVYLTTDGGANWTLVLINPDTTGFFDAMRFWDRWHGILLGDPVGGHFTIYATENGGLHWTRNAGPPAIANEGAFAASGTCLAVYGTHAAWFGTGGPNTARVVSTLDRGNNWRGTATPMFGSTASSGIFSLVFLDVKRGVAVGGDYQKPTESAHTVALTSDGGITWILPGGQAPSGFRSAITYLKARKMLLAVGSGGSDYSLDFGNSWHPLSNDSLNAVAHDGDSVWAVGPKGLILKLTLDR